ncbi:alpha-mannosidase [Thermosipho ferrireducens]|uniref:Alpha-mannosidase n=1 Tax=Thermosipho ferrireducens TaxID=2571116 RepID=A0ABX7S7J0_9BACT|nr:alpha-mannosidase [Thermosipho ferrireducens]QTA37883.1 alpha-mannosidase [Thermosipho ferrireducens]
MYSNKTQLVSRFKHMLYEIYPYVVRKLEVIPEWLFERSSERMPPLGFTSKIRVGSFWNPEPSPVWFSQKIFIPEIRLNERIYLNLWFGGESLVFIDNVAFGEINEYHKELDISPFADGKWHTISVQVVPRGLFGKFSEKTTVEISEIKVIDEEIYKAFIEIKNAIEVLQVTKDNILEEKLANLIDNVFSMMDLPGDTKQYISAISENLLLKNSLENLWEKPRFFKKENSIITNQQRETILNALTYLKREIKVLQKEFKVSGEVNVVGHAHLDYAWLWPIEETKRKEARTFVNAIRLAKKYPEFVFVQSSAQMYADIKENYPEIFKEIKAMVKDGKWEIIGGMWVESDCNIPHVESLIRQFLYGQKFFENEFGKRSNVCWLPDVFGFSWILPQVLKQAGISYFFTIKLTWNEKNTFPYDLCLWRGIDGSKVIYHSFYNKGRGYGGILGPEDIYNVWNACRNKSLINKTLFTFGYSDGGGGPTDEMCENYQILKQYPGLPELKMQPVRVFFESIENVKKDLPVWDGELYLEYHRGTYTSQARIKALHKRAEDELYKAEFMSILAFKDYEYPERDLEQNWKKLLRNEFHDILPGSCIETVKKDAENELENVIKNASFIVKKASGKLVTEKEKGITLLNISSYSQPVIFESNMEKVFFDDKGEKSISQKTYDGKNIYWIENNVEPFSILELKEEHVALKKSPKERIGFFDSHGIFLENEYLKVTINEDGSLNIFDKQFSRNVLDGNGNRLVLYRDIPSAWDAWDIDYHYEKFGEFLKAQNIEIVENGPVRAVVKVSYKIRSTSIIQYYILSKASRRLDIKTVVDWHMRRTMLRAIFPVNVLARYAKYDLSAGYIERSTFQNTDYEKARFEVPAHRWVSISESGYTFSLLNNGKYGHSCKNNIIGLTLLRSPVYPDFYADEGRHEFTYSVFSYGSSEILPTVMEAEKLNKPLMIFKGFFDKSIFPFLKISSQSLKVIGMKRAEKERAIIIRMVEVSGSRGISKISLNNSVKEVWECNILEDKIKKLDVKNGEVKIQYEPFKIYTLMFK